MSRGKLNNTFLDYARNSSEITVTNASDGIMLSCVFSTRSRTLNETI